MKISIYPILLLSFFNSCGQKASTESGDKLATQVNTDTCNDPDASISCCFVNAPTNLVNVMAIATENEAGEKLSIFGTVFKGDGKTPYPDVIIYAYHTDAKGYYSKKGNETGVQKWHGHLHGWCKTDREGNYRINTIRPARYPSNTIPAHIHAAIKKPESNEMYYISDFVFKDDNLVNNKYLKSIESMVGGSGIVDLTKSPDGSWTGKRDITLTK